MFLRKNGSFEPRNGSIGLFQRECYVDGPTCCRGSPAEFPTCENCGTKGWIKVRRHARMDEKQAVIGVDHRAGL